jgi:hypothetical protein
MLGGELQIGVQTQSGIFDPQGHRVIENGHPGLGRQGRHTTFHSTEP